MNSLIEVRDLHYAYPDGTVALHGVHFSLAAGETVAVLGANGSGKTTFLLHLLGLIEGQGAIQVCGKPLAKENLPFIRQKIGVLFQDSDDQLFMPTVEEDVAFGPLNMGLDASEVERRVNHSLELVGMRERAPRAPYHLSAGEKRRVALAGVLAMEPEIIVLDEPATFLDPPSRSALISILRSVAQAKIIVTHDLELARALATRAVFFEKGKIAADGGLEEIIARFAWETSSNGHMAATPAS
jgi:cobalt/nickel transport system ATP-binding protein